MQVEKTVFIGYRRTNMYHAQAVYQTLRQHGYDVFLDYQSIDAGSFEQIILNQIAARAHFLIVLTPSALERCTEPGDWLRREIEHAIDLKRNIVPLMFDQFDFGVVQDCLVGKLTLLPQYNSVEVPATYFEEAMARLITRFLSTPLKMILHPTPVADRDEVEQRQVEADTAPAPSEDQLSAEQYFERANVLVSQGKYRQGVVFYTKALDLNPQYVNAYNNRAHARNMLRDYAGAIEDCNQALKLVPSYSEAHLNRGRARRGQGNTDGALEDYNEVLRLNPHSAMAYNNRGVVRWGQGDRAGALEDYDEALRLNPQLAAAYNNRGYARDVQGNIEGAIVDYKAALSVQPDFPAAKDNLEHALLRKYGASDYATVDLVAASQTQPDSPENTDDLETTTPQEDKQE